MGSDLIKISFKELIKEISGEAKEFPKYTAQIINLANQNAQGTRPRVVGQLSELIVKCPHKEYHKWKDGIYSNSQKLLMMLLKRYFLWLKN
ncbi:MAG: MjaI family restriction endonuclease [Candidatus Pacearchaeota archaeon]